VTPLRLSQPLLAVEIAPRVDVVGVVYGRSPFLRCPVSYVLGTA
jgi:hypothetical protein